MLSKTTPVLGCNVNIFQDRPLNLKPLLRNSHVIVGLSVKNICTNTFADISIPPFLHIIESQCIFSTKIM